MNTVSIRENHSQRISHDWWRDLSPFIDIEVREQGELRNTTFDRYLLVLANALLGDENGREQLGTLLTPTLA